ncbi:MAG: XdhC family protein [Parvibaculaceae bacterium]
MERHLLDQILDARTEKRPVVLAVNLATHEEILIDPEKPVASGWMVEEAERALRGDKGRTVAAGDGADWFFNPFNTPLRLIIVGAVHIAQPLSLMAREAGYDVTVVDPREAFASSARFPDTALKVAWPDEALKDLGLTARTALVTLTHDPKLDDPALQVGLASPCFYIGALGSKKTHAARQERLKERGFDAKAIGRICGPVGLDIGAKSPAEIAISILGQMTQVLRQGAP